MQNVAFKRALNKACLVPIDLALTSSGDVSAAQSLVAKMVQ